LMGWCVADVCWVRWFGTPQSTLHDEEDWKLTGKQANHILYPITNVAVSVTIWATS